jgi:hypothetical protein
LQLPPTLEPVREQVVAALPPVTLPGAAKWAVADPS